MPLARQAVRAGLTVLGYDVDAGLVATLATRRSHVDDLRDGDVREMVAGGFPPTADESRIGTAATAVICVPTPLSQENGPDLCAVTAATEAVARHLRPGMLVVLESTTYPGTTDDMVRPLLEACSGLIAGQDFHLAFSPERIDIADRRESPAIPLARQLLSLGAVLTYHDPYVRDRIVSRTDDLAGAVAAADLVILVQNHRAYDADHLARLARRFFDTRGATTRPEAHRL